MYRRYKILANQNAIQENNPFKRAFDLPDGKVVVKIYVNENPGLVNVGLSLEEMKAEVKKDFPDFFSTEL